MEGREKGDVEAAPWTRALSPDGRGRQSLDTVRSGKRRATQASGGTETRNRKHTAVSPRQINSQAQRSSLSGVGPVRSRESTKATTSAKDMVDIPPNVPEEMQLEESQYQHEGQLENTESDPGSGEEEVEPQQVREEERPDQKSGTSRTYQSKLTWNAETSPQNLLHNGAMSGID